MKCLAAILMLSLAIIPPFSAQAPELKAITGATVLDGSGRKPLKGAVIIIEGNHIKAIGAKNKVALPPNATVIDASGKFVMPGLADMHNHLLDGTPARGRQALRNLRRLLAFGVTTVFYLNGALPLTAQLKTACAPDNAAYPHLFGTGPIVTAKGAVLSDDFRAPATAAEAQAVIRELKAAGVDAVKLGYDEATWTLKTPAPLLPAEVVAALIAAAHQEGLKVFVHAPLLKQAKAVLRAGADGLLHGIIDQPLDDEFIALMKKNRAFYVSTLALFEAVGDVGNWVKRVAAYDERKVYPPSTYDLLSSAAGLKQMETFLPNAQFTRKHLPVLRANLRRVQAAGIPLATGTDSGFPAVLLGPSSQIELILHAEAGLKPAAIMQAATINAARLLGREKAWGTIESGKLADLLILNANPLDDIRNVKQIHRVIKSGVVFDPAELLRQ